MKTATAFAPALLAALCSSSVMAAGAEARDDWQWLPGDAREISRANGASRDTAALEAIVSPRFSVTLGSEFGLVRFQGADLSLRLGALAFFGLESRTRSHRLFPAPGGDSDLWRGMLGYELACSFERFARQHLGKQGALELAFGYYHESDHHTANDISNSPAMAPLLVSPQVGNFVAGDLGLRFVVGSLAFVLRQQMKFFTNGANRDAPFRAGTGNELVVEDYAWQQCLVPFWATSAEVLQEQGHTATRYFRSLLGLSFPGRHGALRIYASFEDGAGKGLLIREHERAFGAGFRFTPFEPFALDR